MNIKTLAAACALATLGTTAFAQTYVGLGLGIGNATAACPFGSNCKDNAPAGKALVGFAFPGTDFAVEGIYTHLGTFRERAAAGNANVKIDMIGVGGAWRPQFGAGWGGVVRAGLAYADVKTSLSPPSQPPQGMPPYAGSYSNDAWHPYVGIGATYAVTPSLRLEADLDATRVGGTNAVGNLHAFTLGATYGF